MPELADIDIDGPPPADWSYGVAYWLFHRHPALRQLVARVPGGIDEDGDPSPSVIADAVNDLDAGRIAWKEYRQRHPEPRDDDEDGWAAWEATGPQLTPGAAAIGVMSRTEVSRLRMFAFWSGERIGLERYDFVGLDGPGQRLVDDWTAALRA